MPERAAVIFLFAQEKLLFRFPFDNPFVIDMNAATPASVSGHRPQTDNSEGTPTAAAANNAPAVSNTAPIADGNAISSSSDINRVTGNTDSTSTTDSPVIITSSGGHFAASDNSSEVAVPSGLSVQKLKLHQERQIVSAASAGVGVRPKPRAAAQSRKSRQPQQQKRQQQQQQQQQQRQQAQYSEAVALSGNARDLDCISASATKISAPPPQSQSVEKVKVKRVTETCVGIQTHTLLHLLRARFSACTTIEFSGGTFLVYPLLPSDVAQRTGCPRESKAAPQESAGDTSAAELDAKTNPEESNDNSKESVKEDEKKPDTRLSHGVLLVVAMNHSDSDDGAIAYFVQLFMNVLVREELHAGYATSQINAIERRLDEMKTGDTTHNAAKSGNVLSETNNSGAHGSAAATGCLTAKEMYAQLLRDPQLTLCAEVAQLARHIADADNEDKVCNAEGANGSCEADGFARSPRLLLCNLFALPPLLRSRARPRRATASTCARLNSNYLFALGDDAIVWPRLARSYANAVGRQAVQLLPFEKVRAAIAALARPWRIGALYRALEIAITDAAQQTDTPSQTAMDASRHHHNNNNNNNNNNSNHGNSNNNTMMSKDVSSAAAASVRPHGGLFTSPDVFLYSSSLRVAAEAVDFLRRSGALAVDTAVTVIFTHSTFRAAPCGPAPARVCPASFVTALLLRELRGAAPLFPLHKKHKSAAKRSAAFVVRCAWGGACPLCEELAASTACAWLSFPQLSAPVRRAAAHRAQQQQKQQQQQQEQQKQQRAGRGEFDAERFRLLADERPWFTHPETFIAAAAVPADQTPLQRFRQLARGDFAGRGDFAIRAECAAGELSEEGVVAELALPHIPHKAREWLAAHRAGIEERLKAEFQQRIMFGAMLGETCEPHAMIAESAARNARNAQQKSQSMREKEPADDEDHWDYNYNHNSSHNNNNEKRFEEAQEESSEANRRRKPQPQRNRQHAPFALSSSLLESAHTLPHAQDISPFSTAGAAPTAASPPVDHLLYLPPRYSAGPARLTCTERIVPIEALMQFVLHHTIALLWGRERGINTETLIRLLERNLRRLRPFLANYAYVLQQQKKQFDHCATAEEGSPTKDEEEEEEEKEKEAADVNSTAQQDLEGKTENEAGKTTHGGDALSESDAAVLERQLRKSYEVFEALSLLDALRCLKGMAIDVVPTRLLLHAVVNAFSDILLIGGQGPASDGLKGR